MSLSKFDSQDTGIPKWQIALSVGGAIIIGAGFYYFYLNRDSEIKKGGKPKSKPPPSSLSEDKSIESNADLVSILNIRNDGNGKKTLLGLFVS